MFESLHEAYRGADGRMAQELLRRHVLKLLRVWRGWFIFSDDFINGLQVGLMASLCYLYMDVKVLWVVLAWQ